MHMETRRTTTQPSRGDGYERRDANVRTLVKLGIGMAVSIAVILVVMKWTFDYFQSSTPLGPPATYLDNARLLPPSPRLQTEPRVELHDYCTAQMRMLDTYGWVDQGNGIVRIPVQRAMDLTLQRGLLQARPANQTPPTDEPAFVSAGGTMDSASRVPPAQDLYGQCGYVNQWGAIPTQ